VVKRLSLCNLNSREGTEGKGTWRKKRKKVGGKTLAWLKKGSPDEKKLGEKYTPEKAERDPRGSFG